jgi:hypothetical protein
VVAKGDGEEPEFEHRGSVILATSTPFMIAGEYIEEVDRLPPKIRLSFDILQR